MINMARIWTLLGGLCFVMVACGGSGSGLAEQGTEGGKCYPNHTCNGTLACLSDLCVDAGGGDVAEDGQGDDSRATDTRTDARGDDNAAPDVNEDGVVPDGKADDLGSDQQTVDSTCNSICDGVKCNNPDNGCGGVCGCSDGKICGPDLCIPEGWHWLRAEGVFGDALTAFNNHDSLGTFDILNGTSFQMVAYWEVVSEETHTINPDQPPFQTAAKWRRQTTGPVTVSFPYDPTGLLVSSATPSINGATTVLQWEMYTDYPETMKLAGVNFRGAADTVYFAISAYASSIPGVVADDGFPQPTGFDKVDGSGNLYRLTNPPMFDPDDLTDVSEWTGTVEYH